MRKFLLLLLIATFVLSSAAQRRRKVPVVQPKINYTELLQHYEFSEAAKQLNSVIAATSSPEKRDSLQHLLRQAEQGFQMLHATQRVVFVDSLVVDKNLLLTVLQLSEETGRWTKTSDLFQPGSAPKHIGEVAFINSLNNAAFFSASPQENGLQLQSAHRSEQRWSSPMALQGIDNTYVAPDYPFVQSDGVTLYFAAKGEESLGGYDIFVTRYNPETRQYVRPSNLGFPFNSPANDYFYAVDPVAGIGFFATDRRQPEGKVCIYTFIPTTERTTYSSEDMVTLRAAAQISSIAASQEGQMEVLQAFLRKQQQADLSPTPKKETFRFVVNDEKVYTTLSAFRQPQARRLVEQWLELQGAYETMQQRHEAVQKEYAALRTQRLQTLLRNMEVQLKDLRLQLQSTVKEIRRIELQQ